MPLIDVRKRFINYSGRYDLIIDQEDYADNGADYYIHTGQRWLDRLGHIYKAEARTYVPLESGQWFTPISSRTIKEVWVSDSQGNKWKLSKKEYTHLRKFYRTDPGGLVPSNPKYYAITPIRTIPEESTITVFDMYGDVIYSNQYSARYIMLRNSLGDVYTLLIDAAHQIVLLYGLAPPQFEGATLTDIHPGIIYSSIKMIAHNNPDQFVYLIVADSGQLEVVASSPPPGPLLDGGSRLYITSTIMTDDYITATTLLEATVHIGEDVTPDSHYANIGLVFLPPVSDGMVIEVIGAFLQPELTTDDSMNYWSEEEPHILVMAACRALEVSYRNKEGVADWEAAIKSELLGLELDLAEMESNEFTQIEG